MSWHDGLQLTHKVWVLCKLYLFFLSDYKKQILPLFRVHCEQSKNRCHVGVCEGPWALHTHQPSFRLQLGGQVTLRPNPGRPGDVSAKRQRPAPKLLKPPLHSEQLSSSALAKRDLKGPSKAHP